MRIRRRARDERRASPRMEVALSCRFARRDGAVIAARTIDVGSGGMRVETAWPLEVGEVVAFELFARAGGPGTGHARVTREEALGVYGVRFERMADAARAQLVDLTSVSGRTS
jgi:hypothetical protein